VFGSYLKRTSCSCSVKSENWSWPITRAHEKYQGRVVTTVICLKHPWSIRLYDLKKMGFADDSAERELRHPA
jgi:hypothetical protein